MEFGIVSIGDRHPNAHTGRIESQHQRIKGVARLATHAEEIGLDVFAMGEHHHPSFIPSSPTTLLAYAAARTERIRLSTATTLSTTNDPVKIAEDYATLQHLVDGRLDMMLGRGSNAEVYAWFGKDANDSIALAAENYALLRRLWDEEVVDWEGRFRTPLRGFTSTPRPLEGVPPFVWHASFSSPETVEQAALYGDGLFAGNLFDPYDHFKRLIDLYRRRYEEHRQAGRHHGPEGGIVGAAGIIYTKPDSQDAWRHYRPVYENHPIMSSSGTLEHAVQHSGLHIGSPAEVADQILAQRDHFGALQRQMFAIDSAGITETEAHEQLDLIGAEILPVLRREL